MRHAPLLLLAASLPAVLQATPPAADSQSQVTIYRCTDDAGQVALRDTPCRTGSEQEVREMQRPTEPPPATGPAAAAAAAPAAPAAPAPPPPAPRVVVLRAPRPMYECVTPDGRDRYTSDSPEGNPRWVPLWTLGVPAPASAWPANAGTWVRDTCFALPQAEVCARLRDERREIERRFFNAQPSEREVLQVRKRGLQSRLDADCG